MTTFKFKTLWIFVSAIIFVSSNGEENCVRKEDSYENYLGTKTPYRLVANLNSSEIKFEGCQATKLWSLVRHGTRNPNTRLIERMSDRLSDIKDLILENLTQANDYIHNSDLERFRKWSPKLKQKDAKKLTLEGQDEMLLLAERIQSRFPKILEKIYSDSSYQFKYTATQRTKKSAESFAAGLFGRNTVKDINFPEPLKQDPILRFYKLCSKWRKEVSKNPSTIVERTKFESSPVAAKTIKEINQRLGFTKELDFSDIYDMYMTCAFETSWNKKRKSPWCAPFSIDNLRVMEFAEDLKYYWVDGYGHELTYKQACPAFNAMIDFFQKEEKLPRATVYFTHSGTLLKMLAHMKLYQEESHLKALDFNKSANRKWKVSQIDPFGTNLAFILFECGNKPQILTMHQERIVRLPSCPNSDLCPIEDVLKFYSESVQECAFDQMCDN